MRAISLLIAAILAVPSAAAQTGNGFGWKLNDEAAPADAARASNGNLGAQLMITDDYEGFWKAWEGPSPPQVSVTDRVERGKPVHAMLIFSGCKAAADGNCNLTAEFAIMAPDGTPYGETVTGKVWGGPPPAGYNLQLSEGSIGLVIEPEDSLGQYTFKVSVTDHVAGSMLQVSAPVEAVAAGSLASAR
jgi:hypothetical protein